MKDNTFWKTPTDQTVFPRMIKARQKLISQSLNRIDEEISRQFENPLVKDKIRPGMKIAVGTGSRGIARLRQIVQAVVESLKKLGAEPFIVPAMGSHGGATVEGQRQVLASYGITEETLRVPVRATMDVVEIGRMPEDLPVYFDAIAAAAEGIVVVNRVKLHTDFRGDYESGLLKMLVIGLGKQRGAKVFHREGFDRFPDLIPQVGTFILGKLPVLFGVAIVEDGRHQPAVVEVVPTETLLDREKELLREAKRMLANIPFPEIDVLIVEEIGKNISGCGMDPNVTGRFLVPPLSLRTHAPHVERIAGLNLTSETHGNALGIGAADVITRCLYDLIDYQKMYANADTAGEVAWARVPVVADTERDAIALALRTAKRVKVATARVVWIKNTLELEDLYVSEALQNSAPETVEWIGRTEPMCFDDSGTLAL